MRSPRKFLAKCRSQAFLILVGVFISSQAASAQGITAASWACDTILNNPIKETFYSGTIKLGDRLGPGFSILMGKNSEIKLLLRGRGSSFPSTYVAKQVLQGFKDYEITMTDKGMEVTIITKNNCLKIALNNEPPISKVEIVVTALSGSIYFDSDRGGIFGSSTLDGAYDAILTTHKASYLKHLLHFRNPKKGETLPTNTLILIDRESDLVLKITAEEDAVSAAEIVSETNNSFLSVLGSLIIRDGEYFETLSGNKAFILRYPPEIMNVSVESSSGQVFISTNTDLIGSISPKENVFAIGPRDIAEGFIEGDYGKGNIGIIPIDDVIPFKEGINGTFIISVYKDSPAQKAGIMPNDMIIKVNGVAFENIREFYQLLNEAKKSNELTITVVRNSKILPIHLVIESDSLDCKK